MDDVRKRRASSFGGVTGYYVSGRPGYPERAIRWALEGMPGDRVLDLGAGTGKLTASLVELGYAVTAVEPLPAMRAALTESLPQVEALAGTAEHLPVAAASQSGIVVGQAYHWFNHEKALAEMARVLEPGGHVGLLWNTRDDSVPWVAALSQLLVIPVDMASEWDWSDGDSLSTHPAFTDYAHIAVPHTLPYTPARLLDWARSTSTFAIMDDDERELRLAEIAELCRSHPDLRGREEFDMHFVTMTVRARRVYADGQRPDA